MIFLRPPGVGGPVTTEGAQDWSGTGNGGTVTLDGVTGRIGQLAIMTVVGSNAATDVAVTGWDLVSRTRVNYNSSVGIYSKRLTGAESTVSFTGVVSKWVARVEYFGNAGIVVHGWDGATPAPGATQVSAKPTIRSVSTMAGSLTNIIVAGNSTTDHGGWTSLNGTQASYVGSWSLKDTTGSASVFISSWREKDQELKAIPSGMANGPASIAHTFTYTINPLIATNELEGTHGLSLSSPVTTGLANTELQFSNWTQVIGNWGTPTGFLMGVPGYGTLAASLIRAGNYGGEATLTLNDVPLKTVKWNDFGGNPPELATPMFSVNSGASIRLMVKHARPSITWNVETSLMFSV